MIKRMIKKGIVTVKKGIYIAAKKSAAGSFPRRMYNKMILHGIRGKSMNTAHIRAIKMGGGYDIRDIGEV